MPAWQQALSDDPHLDVNQSRARYGVQTRRQRMLCGGQRQHTSGSGEAAADGTSSVDGLGLAGCNSEAGVQLADANRGAAVARCAKRRRWPVHRETEPKKFQNLVPARSSPSSAVRPRQNSAPKMAKRAAESDEKELEAIKNGERPMEIDGDEVGEFEDEYEDEFESDDEILEAGVDGRPDEEREAEERESTHHIPNGGRGCILIQSRRYGSRPGHFHTRPAQALRWRDPRA